MGKQSLISSKNKYERDIEDYLRTQVKKIGGYAYKFSSPMKRAVPDRICIFPGGIVYFIEVKKPKGELTPAQQRELTKLRDFGCLVTTIWSVEDVDRFIGKMARILQSVERSTR